MSVHFQCPLCGTDALTADQYRHGSRTIKCWVCMEDGGAFYNHPGEYLTALGEAMDAPSGGHVKLDPERWLVKTEDDPGRPGRMGRWNGECNDAYFQGCTERLFSGDELATQYRQWLVHVRRINLKTARRWSIGYNGIGLTLPCRLDGRLVGAKLRTANAGAKTMAGWGKCEAWPLYAVGDERRLLLVEGELDALAARSVGIPAASVPLGKGTWREEWSAQLAGRRVDVMFDVGAEAQAVRAVARLQKAGVWARHTPLPGQRLREGYDLTDYLRDHGRAQLERLIGWR